MTVEAHDALIDILRQLIFRAEKARLNHDRNARPTPPRLQDDEVPVALHRLHHDPRGLRADEFAGLDAE